LKKAFFKKDFSQISPFHNNAHRFTNLNCLNAESFCILSTETYDVHSRLTDTQIGTATSTYSYVYTNASPQVQSLTRPNGSVTSYYYDDTLVNRLETISNKNSGSTIINQFTYVYSNDLRSSETVTNGSSITFSNDLVTYDYNAVNQLLTSTNTNSNKSFTHDNDGNMTRGYTVDGYVFSAAYDANNHLTALEYTDTASSIDRKTEYSYSGDHFLAVMKKYEDGSLTNETRFVRHGLLPLQERNSANNVTREYTWGLNMGGGIGGLLNVKQGGQNYSYLYDGKGNVTALIDSYETTTVTYTYDAFGNLMVKTGSLDQPFQFSTKRYDSQTGLSYYGYRYYSPVLGRWITRDPLGEAGGINLYGFVGGNPVNWVDPSGLDAIYINYDYYPIETPIGKLPLGHGGVVAVDTKAGVTKYYEFGRYGDKRGVVRGAPDIEIPNVEIGKNGLPTQQSLGKLYEYLSKKLGKGSKISATYYPNTNFQAVIDFAEKFRKNHPDYSIFTNNCKTFGKTAATAGQ
jgi:RHS repeat-associated protein